MKKDIKVLVVDDSAFSRQTIRKMLDTDPVIKVIGTANNGMDAMSKVMRLKPDLITLDFEMPEMDGLGFLRWLMQQRPTPVIMVTSNSDKKVAFKALELGAADVIAKPTKRASHELRNIEEDLIAKVRGVRGLNMDVLSKNMDLFKDAGRKPARSAPLVSGIKVVAVGASTGGPPALQLVLSRLPSDLPCGMVISQHMPRGFTKPLAARLDKSTGLNVKEAEDGDLVESGRVLLCPGGFHLTFKKTPAGFEAALKEAGGEDRYKPSVDVMMSSAARRFGKNMLGVVLTGMGNDGMKGMKEIKSKGGYTIAESEKTAIVFGMPAEVARAGAASEVLPLDEIPDEIIRVVMGERRL
jgi:two-component system chemotaxis response regulator CheB